MVSNVVSYILIGVLLVGMVVLMFIQGSRQKKAQADYLVMLDSLRPGTKVKMASGLLGRIKEIREEVPGFKTITLNVGEGKNVIEMTFVIEAVQGIVNEEKINEMMNANRVAAAIKDGTVTADEPVAESATATPATTENATAADVSEPVNSAPKKTTKKRK